MDNHTASAAEGSDDRVAGYKPDTSAAVDQPPMTAGEHMPVAPSGAESTPPAAPALRRAKFRDRPGAAPAGETSGGHDGAVPAPARPAQRTRGILAAAVAVAIVAIILLQSSLRGAGQPAAPTAAPTATANAAPAGALTTQNGAALAAQPVVPAGGGGHLQEPHEAVLGPGHAIYVADPVAHAVLVYSLKGTYLGTVAPRGTSADSEPYSHVAAANGHLYVLDSSANPAAARLADYGGRLGSPSHTIATGLALSHGRSLASDVATNLYVANPATNSITIYRPSGTVVLSRRTPLSASLGDYNQPSAVALGRDQSIFVLDSTNQRIEQFSPTWQPRGQWPAPTSDTLHSAHLLPIGAHRLLVTDPTGSLLDYDLGTSPATIRRHALAGVTAPGPLGIAPLDGGHVLVTDVRNRAVWSVAIP